MSEKKKFKKQLYNKFFIELKKKENIDKVTFYGSNFNDMIIMKLIIIT